MTQAKSQTESSTSPSSGEVEVVLVPNSPRSEWLEDTMREKLAPAIAKSNGRITIEQVFQLMDRNMTQVWLAMDDGECITVITTEILEFISGRRCLKVVLAGGYGSMNRAVGPVMSKLEAFAMLEVCASVVVDGRKGWERALPDGYKFSHVTCEKELF